MKKTIISLATLVALMAVPAMAREKQQHQKRDVVSSSSSHSASHRGVSKHIKVNSRRGFYGTQHYGIADQRRHHKVRSNPRIYSGYSNHDYGHHRNTLSRKQLRRLKKIHKAQRRAAHYRFHGSRHGYSSRRVSHYKPYRSHRSSVTLSGPGYFVSF